MRFINGGELVIECLQRQGIRHVFSIMGGQMATLYDAIGHRPDIDIYVPRNETVAPIMAAGYTVVSGVPAVSMTTVGAGVVYEISGLLKAWLDYLPVISIAPQVQSFRTKPHQESLQSCNQDELFFPITKWNTIVYHWDRIPQMIDRGFREALAGIPGPVHIDIPVDILFKYKALSRTRQRRLFPPPQTTRYVGPICGDEQQLTSAARAFVQARNPLIVLGQGIGRPGRYEQIGELLDRLMVPVVTTTLSNGVINGSNSCCAGSLDLFLGSEQGMEAMRDVDLLLIVGIDRYTKNLLSLIDSSSDEKTTVVQVETDPSAFLTRKLNLFPVYADPLTAVSAMSKAVISEGTDRSSWHQKFISAGDSLAAQLSRAIEGPATAIQALSASITKNDIVVVDGKCSVRVTRAFLHKAQYQHLFVMDESDVVGAGLPFAAGAAIASPDSRVILICDNDALFRHLRELHPVTAAGLGLKIICLDDTEKKSRAVDMDTVLTSLDCRVQKFPRGTQKTDTLFGNKSDTIAVLLN